MNNGVHNINYRLGHSVYGSVLTILNFYLVLEIYELFGLFMKLGLGLVRFFQFWVGSGNNYKNWLISDNFFPIPLRFGPTFGLIWIFLGKT